MSNSSTTSLPRPRLALERYLAGLGVDDPIAFYNFVSSRLQQYHLNGLYTSDDVVGEALRRWHAQPESKRATTSWVEGWFKKTALYCIKEFRRKETPQWQKEKVRFVSIDESPALANELADLSETLEYDPQWRTIRSAMSELSPEEQELLNLSVVQGLSGSELVQHYSG